MFIFINTKVKRLTQIINIYIKLKLIFFLIDIIILSSKETVLPLLGFDNTNPTRTRYSLAF